ncbi:MAG: MotA/TolQ/ExbB proton channel family protein [Candidatus Latescibacteria bacterium]|nr:MotA/TolQ/ExbB proton channel family protein [Candidatus Latescibacterota bacterium]
MKRLTIVACAVLFAWSGTPAAQDVREAAKKAEADRMAAEVRAQEVEAKITSDRAALRAEVEKLEAQGKQLALDVQNLQKRKAAGQERHDALTEKWTSKEVEFREISGNVRIAAKDIEALLNTSQLTALYPERLETIAPVLEPGYFPGIDDISGMTDVLLDEMKRSGQVTLQQGPYVGRDGENHAGDLLTLGKFTALYRSPEEVGFLTFNADSKKLFALTNLPDRKMAKTIANYFEGKSEMAPLDIASGESLVGIGDHTSIVEEFKEGGDIMWPILLVGLVVVAFTTYKLTYLKRVHGDTDTIMGTVNDLAAKGDWAGVEGFMQKHQGHNWPVLNVLREGVRARREDRETLESVLQESILREMPRLERGVSIMAVLGAIAPLLGLLGTVTGMITTFQVITLYGTGDPKLMSSGISEALVATKWGLCVAVPTMLIHTLLARRVHGVVSDMEEKAVTLSNTIQKEQRRGTHIASA